MDDNKRISSAVIAAIGCLIYTKFVFEMGWVTHSSYGKAPSITVVAALLTSVSFGIIAYYRSPVYTNLIGARTVHVPVQHWSYWSVFRTVATSAAPTAVMLFFALHIISAGYSTDVSKSLMFGSHWSLYHPKLRSTLLLFFHIYLMAAVHAVGYGWTIGTKTP